MKSPIGLEILTWRFRLGHSSILGYKGPLARSTMMSNTVSEWPNGRLWRRLSVSVAKTALASHVSTSTALTA
jgi:hypothetical protein